ncbi:hypothetical protein OC835_007649, partial [Tilletia horrida]
AKVAFRTQPAPPSRSPLARRYALFMGCSSLLYAATALLQLSASMPSSWAELRAAVLFYPTALLRLLVAPSSSSRSIGGSMSAAAAAHQSGNSWHSADHDLLSLNSLLAENRLALLILLTSFAQSGLRSPRHPYSASPFSTEDPPAAINASDKARFEPLRGRSAFSLRSGLDSPRTSRPQSRTHSPSSSVTSAKGSSGSGGAPAHPAARRGAAARSAAAAQAGNSKQWTSTGTPAERTDRGVAHQSLSFADRIFVKFRTSSRIEAEDAPNASVDDDDRPTPPATTTRISLMGTHAPAHKQHAEPLPSHHEQHHNTALQSKFALSTAASTAPASGQLFHLDQVLHPVTEEERALRKVYDDLLLSRAAEVEHRDQLAAHSVQASSARAALEASLETLRSRRKADDTERASLRSRVKVLDEERRVAEAKRREAERKVDGWKNKVGALEREWEEITRSQSSAKDSQTSLRDEWKRREEELGKRKVAVEKDLEELQKTRDADDAASPGPGTAVGRAGKQSSDSHQAALIKSPKSPNRFTKTPSSPSSPSPTSATPTGGDASKSSTGSNRDHSNAKVVRDRIKTLEGQIKKERERLERVKRSAQAAAAGTNNSAHTTSSPTGTKSEGHAFVHEGPGKGRHAHYQHRHGGSATSPQVLHKGHIGSHAPASPSRATFGNQHSHPLSTGAARAIPGAGAGEVPGHAALGHISSSPLPPFNPSLSSAFTNHAPGSHLPHHAFEGSTALRSLDPFDFNASPIPRHAEAVDGNSGGGHGEGLLPVHMQYGAPGAGVRPNRAGVQNPLSTLGDGHPEHHLPAWVRTSLLGSHFGAASASAAPGAGLDLDPLRLSNGGGARASSGSELPSFMPRLPHVPGTELSHHNGSAALSGSPLLGKSSASMAPQLPWDWPTFRSGAGAGAGVLPRIGAGAGVGEGGGSLRGPSASTDSAMSTGTSNVSSLFGSSDVNSVLPIHTRTNLGIPSVSALGSSSNAASPRISVPASLPFLGVGTVGSGPTAPLLPPSIAVTPVKTMPQLDGIGGAHHELDGSAFAPSPTPSSGSGKARPRTNKDGSARRRTRMPVSPYTAGLLPRNLLSYGDDEDEMAALNEMESAWASLEEADEEEADEDGEEDEEDERAEEGKLQGVAHHGNGEGGSQDVPGQDASHAAVTA